MEYKKHDAIKLESKTDCPHYADGISCLGCPYDVNCDFDMDAQTGGEASRSFLLWLVSVSISESDT